MNKLAPKVIVVSITLVGLGLFYLSTDTMGNIASNGSCVKFSLLTWNIWFGSNQGWDEPDMRWVELLNIVLEKGPDVIGFQECTKPFLEIVDSHPSFKEHYDAASEVPANSRYFVMVFIKKGLKIMKKKTIQLKTALNRKCQFIEVEKEGSTFRFGTVHIESYVTSPNIRETQMETIFKVLEHKPSLPELAFLVGDFNFHETDKENKFIDKSNFTDVWPVTNKENKGLTFDTASNLMTKHSVLTGEAIASPILQRLDRILYVQKSNDWVPKLCEIIGNSKFKDAVLSDGTHVPLFPSDHYGLFSIFKKTSNT